jgi:hypothetical protein
MLKRHQTTKQIKLSAQNCSNSKVFYSLKSTLGEYCQDYDPALIKSPKMFCSFTSHLTVFKHSHIYSNEFVLSGIYRYAKTRFRLVSRALRMRSVPKD